MNFKKAVDLIKKSGHWGHNCKVDWEKKTVSLYFPDGSLYKNMTSRQTVAFARCWTKDYTPTPKRIAKELSAGKDRTAARDSINKGDFDSIPPKRRCKEEDPWGYD